MNPSFRTIKIIHSPFETAFEAFTVIGNMDPRRTVCCSGQVTLPGVHRNDRRSRGPLPLPKVAVMGKLVIILRET